MPVDVFHSNQVRNPHPQRPQEIATGRSERSPDPKIQVRDFVDVEKFAAHIAAAREAGQQAIHENPLVDLSLLIKQWFIFLNDHLGDCTCASVAHGIMVFAAMAGVSVTITDADVERMYEHSGYKPGQPETDQGWTLQEAAAYAMKIGMLGKPDIAAYAGVSATDDDAQQVSMELFGGLSSGMEVPESAMSDFQEGKPWTVVKGSPIVGGHAIWKVKSELRKSGLFVTWGSLQLADEEFEKTYFDEYMAFVPVDWESKLPEQILALGVVDFSRLSALVTQYTA